MSMLLTDRRRSAKKERQRINHHKRISVRQGDTPAVNRAYTHGLKYVSSQTSRFFGNEHLIFVQKM